MPAPEIVDDVTIINRMLARIGSSPIGAIDEDTDKCRQCVAVYYDRRDQLLSRYQWRFNGVTRKLDQAAETAENGFDTTISRFMNGWRYAFDLPGTRLGPPRKVLSDPRDPNRPLRNCLIEGNRIYADVKPLWATCGEAIDPENWPAWFRLPMIVLGAADLCVPIAHDKNLADDLYVRGEGTPSEKGLGGMVGLAIAADISGAPPAAPLLADDPLTSARF